MLDNTSKVCLDLNQSPSATVQPSGLAGQPTFLRYSATLRNAVKNSSSRNVLVNFTLSPATGFVEFSADNGLLCTQSGSTISCAIDKLDDTNPLRISATANAPADMGAQTAISLLNTAVFGFGGRTQTVQSSVMVSNTSGASYVPPNTTATLVTAPVSGDPSMQVNAANPLWGKAVLPPQPEGYLAQISLLQSGPSRACTGGLFLAQTDGGPYLCKDQDFPYDSGNPLRWVMLDTSTADFTVDLPMSVTVVHDPSIISRLQLPPSAVAPTGTPPYAVFYSALPIDGSSTYPVRAAGTVCTTTPAPPCLNGVTRYGNGVWQATIVKVNDATDLAAAPSPLAPLMAFMDYLVNVAGAGIIKPPSLMN